MVARPSQGRVHGTLHTLLQYAWVKFELTELLLIRARLVNAFCTFQLLLNSACLSCWAAAACVLISAQSSKCAV